MIDSVAKHFSYSFFFGFINFLFWQSLWVHLLPQRNWNRNRNETKSETATETENVNEATKRGGYENSSDEKPESPYQSPEHTDCFLFSHALWLWEWLVGFAVKVRTKKNKKKIKEKKKENRSKKKLRNRKEKQKIQLNLADSRANWLLPQVSERER